MVNMTDEGKWHDRALHKLQKYIYVLERAGLARCNGTGPTLPISRYKIIVGRFSYTFNRPGPDISKTDFSELGG